jgi:hypothetical protein
MEDYEEFFGKPEPKKISFQTEKENAKKRKPPEFNY